MSWGRVRALLFKEWMDALRDFRTLFAAVLLPILLPGMIIGLTMLSLKTSETQEKEPIRVGVIGNSAILGEALIADQSVRLYYLKELTDPDIKSLVNACAYDILIQLDREFDSRLARGAPAGLKLNYDDLCSNYGRAREVVLDRLQKLKERVVAQRAEQRGFNAELLDPFQVASRDHASPRKAGGSTLAQILPFLLVLVAVQAAVIPATDIVVGEKERKTLESLFASPLRPAEILAGKLISVVGISYGAVVVNLASNLLFFRLITRFYPAVDFAIPLATAGLLLLLVLPLVTLFGAMAMGVSVFARTSKEAQSYFALVFLLAMLPGFAGIVPGAVFTLKTALIPVGSAVLVLKDAFLGKVTVAEVAWVTSYHLILAVVFIFIASRLMESEEVLFAPTGLSWKSLVKPKAADQAPTIWEVLFLYLAVFLGLIIVGTALFNETAQGFATVIVVTQVGVILGFSLLMLRLLGYDIKTTLGLRYPGFWNLAAGVMMALGGLGITLGLTYFLMPYLPPPVEFNEELLGGITKIGLWGSLFLLAFLPAVCEEILFRGVILSGVKRKMDIIPASIFVGVLFGLMHFQAPLRVIMITVLGTLFTFLALRTRSIFPSMVAHLTGNGLTVSIAVLAPTIDPTTKDAMTAAQAFALMMAGVAFFGLAMALSAPPKQDSRSHEPGGTAAGV
ncbi:MAG: ABC transporter permease subunit/CPBP intramembrane protease [bacterium]